ncbi:MAG: protein kinase domain-containing protein, partial [Actinomycetota bacterium]
MSVLSRTCLSCDTPYPSGARYCAACGTKTPPESGDVLAEFDEERGATELEWVRTALADRYAVQRAIGSGGTATVYLAEDLRHRRKVAVKVLRTEISALVGPARFLREIEIAAQLQHPHILPVYDSGEVAPQRAGDPRLLFFVMPFAAESLASRLNQGPLPIAEAVRILHDVADALAFAHAHGVVHR